MPPLPYGKSRNLPHGEIMFAQKIFGASIQYTWVKIHHGKYMRFQPEHVVMTPNGEIYFPTRFYEDDYSSTLKPELKHLFIYSFMKWRMSAIPARLLSQVSWNFPEFCWIRI
ncbi:MAG: hypothetical protein LBU76_01760 [Azoarcus sp.]|nr:hypothetical protein [Azoarcus sp.]